MYPIRIRSCVAELLAVAAFFAVGAPQADAHGGGGHGGGRGAGAPSGGHYHPYSSYHGYNAWSSYWRESGLGPTQPVWAGFPEDLPFARLQRFVASRLHRLHLPGRPIS
jgi:hypothetical protein